MSKSDLYRPSGPNVTFGTKQNVLFVLVELKSFLEKKSLKDVWPVEQTFYSILRSISRFDG